jgi:hypothetical protein
MNDAVPENRWKFTAALLRNRSRVPMPHEKRFRQAPFRYTRFIAKQLTRSYLGESP